MKNLELTQMEDLSGGCSAAQEEALLWIGGVASAGSLIPGANLIFAPTAIGAWIGSAYCHYN
ncbi:hypothetical protein [Psychroflexus tropicus]|uniref:hypothetical protein n=1 Tax=Psychroflexus tropicus TaxID=197345 RepID=UPI0003A61906|nr:hypothetical protein [Psychroflexus tropicus]